VRCGAVRYGTVRYGTVRYGTVLKIPVPVSVSGSAYDYPKYCIKKIIIIDPVCLSRSVSLETMFLLFLIRIRDPG
jgi:hypothetical protein